MFIILRKIVVAEGHADEVVARFNKREVVTEQDGFIDMTVMKQRALRGEQEVVVMARWKSEDHWKKWESSDAHKEMHRAQRDEPKLNHVLRTESGVYNVAVVKKATTPRPG